MERKRSKKERAEQARRDAEDLPIVRQLRDLYARGMAELHAERAAKQRVAEEAD
jgi:hypothetical protein